jgi:hypothetical protein
LDKSVRKAQHYTKTNMKNSNLTAITLAGMALASSLAASGADDRLPTGEISSAVTMIQVGQTPQLNWKINYPPTNPFKDGKLEIPAVANVFVIGQGVTRSNGTHVRTRGTMSIAGSGHKTVFDGVNSDVSQNFVALESLFGADYKNNIIPQNTEVRFGGQYYKGNGNWSRHYFSGDGTTNVRILKDGDTPPSGLGYSNGPTLESFLKPYLDSAGKVKIGALDIIVFMELTHTKEQSSDPGYDFQDMLFLVKFSDPKTIIIPGNQ